MLESYPTYLSLFMVFSPEIIQKMGKLKITQKIAKDKQNCQIL